jgi:hypothetical protein
MEQGQIRGHSEGKKMGGKFGMMGFCAAVAGALVLTSLPAGAQTETQKKRSVTGQSQTTLASRPKTRLNVPARSFLDGGTELLPGERKFTDYAFPPGYSPLGSALGPGRDFRRQPFNDPWDVPGMIKF